MEDFPKRYEPADFEKKIYDYWMSKDLFRARIDPSKEPYVIVIPPPNVTGRLHLGHALNNTIQDILIRYHKMKGYETLWVPGMDHAGIATQVVVEKKLAKEGIKKEDLGREGFLKEVWKWKEEYGDRIREQLKRMGCALDWSRERFTLDEGLSKAVAEVFVRLYEKGLVYRGHYIVNWCPRCHTALSDEQVEHIEERGKLYYIKYPFVDGDGGIVVATTRPETMLGDTAVAVHPDDERYKKFIGKKVKIPLIEREIPIISDSQVDRDFGTGAVKVTPAHDPVDFEIGKRHSLESIVIMDTRGYLNENAGILIGEERFKARERIVELLKEKDYLVKIEEHVHNVGHCERCGTVIEPYLSEQWFVKMKPLAEKGIKAVKEGRIRFYPERWKNLYFHWMENVRDWCISRQLWWGHRIPVYYCKECGNEMVSREKVERCSQCGSENVYQDEDVLDTWFSSWLWPFSTLGWPEETEDMKYFYPTSTLTTGWDIIYLWVARMIMAGLEFTGKEPFRDVVFHVMIRDAKGRKMSKSLGNSPDPIDLIDKYGADGLRIGLILITPREQDMLFSESRIETGRNFINKIWNASRLLYMTGKHSPAIPDELDEIQIWIIQRLNNLIKSIERDMKRYEMNRMAWNIYNFFWREFCDWYLEIMKIRKGSYISLGLYILREVLKIMHPFIPFVTEELWRRLKFSDGSILEQSFPEEIKIEREVDIDYLFELITVIRNLRAESGIKPDEKIDIDVNVDKDTEDAIRANFDIISNLAGVNNIKDKGDFFITGVFSKGEVNILIESQEAMERIRRRYEKELKEIERHIETTERRLANKDFLEKAPEEVVKGEREKLKRLKEKKKRLEKVIV